MVADLSDKDGKNHSASFSIFSVTDILNTKLLLSVQTLPFSLTDLLSTFDTLTID